jgi:site-specific recombinase XerD
MNNNLSIVNITKEQIIEVFKRRDISGQTLNEYVRLFEEFRVFMQGRQFNRGTLNEYKRHLSERIENKNFGVDFAMKKLTAAKMFCEELFGKDKITVKNFQKNPNHKKEGITPEEMQIVVKQLRKMEFTPKTIRLLAIVALMQYQGLRQIEISRG